MSYATDRKWFAWLGVIGMFVALLVSCGDDTPGDIDWRGYIEGPNEGSGWLSIYEPYGDYPDARVETSDLSIAMDGHTFIPPDTSCPSFTGSFGSGYTVSWRNAANASSGTAIFSLNCWPLVQAYWSIANSFINNEIPLELGENVITVTSSDTYGNVGRGTVRVVRLTVATE